MKFSSDNTNILAIGGDYQPDKKFGFIRNDSLYIFDKTGKTIKSFSFEKYLKNKKNKVQPYINNWTTDSYKNKSFEATHVNSFSEIINKSAQGEKPVGYVAHCDLQKKIYILNSELTEVTHEFSTGNKSIHDVQPYSEDRLIYYMNQDHDKAEPRLGTIETYNTKTQQFSTLYGPFSEDISALAGSSVQVLPEDQLFILHSSTLPRKGASAEAFYFEYVDLKNKTNKIIKVENIKSPQGARIIDAEDYIKNNIGN